VWCTSGINTGTSLIQYLNIYMNNVVNISNVLNMILGLFADDTNILIFGNNITDNCNTINTELNKLARWFKLNKLSLNMKKLII